MTQRDRHDAGRDMHDAGKDRHTQGESKVAFSRAPAVFPALSLPRSTPCHSRVPPLSFPQFLAGIQKKTTGHQDTPSQLIAARVTAFSFVH